MINRITAKTTQVRMRLNCRFTIARQGSSGRSKKSGSSEDAESLRRGNADVRFMLTVAGYDST